MNTILITESTILHTFGQNCWWKWQTYEWLEPAMLAAFCIWRWNAPQNSFLLCSWKCLRIKKTGKILRDSIALLGVISFHCLVFSSYFWSIPILYHLLWRIIFNRHEWMKISLQCGYLSQLRFLCVHYSFRYESFESLTSRILSLFTSTQATHVYNCLERYGYKYININKLRKQENG